MLVVGLTGGIASGKTTVSRLLQEEGVPVICADELARDVVEPGSAALAEIRRQFGDEVLDQNGRLDRIRMADLVFGDPARRNALEGIIHPRVEEAMEQRLKELESSGHRLVVADVPLLYEKGWERNFHLVIVVYVSREVQVQRLMLRDSMTVGEALARLDAQMPIDQKKDRGDRSVDNMGTLEHTRRQVKALVRELMIVARQSKPDGVPQRGKILTA